MVLMSNRLHYIGKQALVTHAVKRYGYFMSYEVAVVVCVLR